MEQSLLERSHPSRALVGTMLEMVFRAALRRGAIFKVRKLSSSADVSSDGQPDAVVPGKRDRMSRSANSVKESARAGPAGAALPVAEQKSAEVKYLRITPDDNGKLTAELLSHLPADASVFRLQGDTLVEDMNPNDAYGDVMEVKNCPSRHILHPLMKHAGAIDAVLKDNPIEHLSELLFQFSLSLRPQISVTHIERLRQVLDRKALTLFFMVPNEHLFQRYRPQAYRQHDCPHGRSGQCMECAKVDDDLTQYVLLCDLPGWHNYEYLELGPILADRSSESKSNSRLPLPDHVSAVALPMTADSSAQLTAAPLASDIGAFSAQSASLAAATSRSGPAPME